MHHIDFMKHFFFSSFTARNLLQQLLSFPSRCWGEFLRIWWISNFEYAFNAKRLVIHEMNSLPFATGTFSGEDKKRSAFLIMHTSIVSIKTHYIMLSIFPCNIAIVVYRLLPPFVSFLFILLWAHCLLLFFSLWNLMFFCKIYETKFRPELNSQWTSTLEEKKVVQL